MHSQLVGAFAIKLPFLEKPFSQEYSEGKTCLSPSEVPIGGKKLQTASKQTNHHGLGLAKA
jgi:hypothetical protein